MAQDDLNIETILIQIEQQSNLSREDRDENLIESLIGRLRSIAASTDSADSWFGLGYGLYFHPHRETRPSIGRELVRAMSRALELEPDHSWAHFYLGYHLYDFKRFESAERHFRSVQPDALPLHLAIRRMEMIAASSVRARGLPRSEGALADYASAAEEGEEFDVIPDVLEWALLDALRDGERPPNSIASLIRRINRASLNHWLDKIVNNLQ